jgi:hypothetical protein
MQVDHVIWLPEIVARWGAVNIEPELMEELRRIARDRKVSTQTLVNVWLRQQVDRLAPQTSNAA